MKEATLAGGIIEITDLGPSGPRDGFAPRGTPTLSRGDVTGARHLQNVDAKASHQAAVAKTIAEVQAGDDIEIVTLPGGATYAVPRQVMTWLRFQVGKQATR